MSRLVTHGRELRPNTSVQRTRSSASPLRSPLMRCPLGATESALGRILAAMVP
jgi:hypothetical protein